MKRNNKTSHLQIRVSDAEKTAIRKKAELSGMDMSRWILEQLFPPVEKKFNALLDELKAAKSKKIAFAELNDFLSGLNKKEFVTATASAPDVILDDYLNNYVAAMIEQAATLKQTTVPAWVQTIPGLAEPVFGTDLNSLRLYLLKHSPAPFRKRNIFIDASIGDRV